MISFFNYFYKFSLGLVVILYFSCAQFRGPKYPEIIYNNKQPLISVKYEYGEIQIILPIQYDGDIPENILFKVDRASMLNSLETRAPFLNNDIVDFSTEIPLDQKINNRMGKLILRKIMVQSWVNLNCKIYIKSHIKILLTN